MDINDIKSYGEGVRELLHINYYNAIAKKKLIEYCNNIGYDIEEIIAKNQEKLKSRKNFCKKCGKEIPLHNKFCSSSCAASYNNQNRVISQKTRNKISASLSKTLRDPNYEYTKNGRKLHICICEICGKTFKSVHKNTTHCSKKCVCDDPKYKEKLREGQLKLIKEGKHKGWISRKIISYPERFWMKVLDNNNISYIHNFRFQKRYFLDFYIVLNGKEIDLEIDGRQHQYRQKEDNIRDTFVKEHNVIVYRIKWNSINNDKGKELMKEKINTFLCFLQTL